MKIHEKHTGFFVDIDYISDMYIGSVVSVSSNSYCGDNHGNSIWIFRNL